MLLLVVTLFCLALLTDGERGTFSIMQARGSSNSSSSSSLVCPFLWIIDAFLAIGTCMTTSAAFSAMQEDGGGRYTTGAAVHGKVLIKLSEDRLSTILCIAD